METETTNQDKRIVAIVGRPNVGKSATFNRLAGRRIAIVHAESGVTRDRLMREVLWGEERFELVDTGGVCNIDGSSTPDVIEAGIRRQVDVALGDATMAIFVVDIQSGVHPMDLEVAGILRASGCPTVVAANKADGPSHDVGVADFQQLGFPVFPVSALQNRGFDALMVPVVKALPEAENLTVADPVRVAIVGRPNVGKSSYVNRLLRNDRVIVSNIPGTTRDSVDVPFVVGKGAQARHYVLVDTAGMRRSGKVDSTVERFSLMRAEKSIEDANVVVHVMDAEQGPTAYDKKIASLISKHERGCIVLVNKWDLAEGQVTQTQYGPALVKTMPFMGHCPVLFASAQSGYNIRRTIEAIDYVAGQVAVELPTGILNRTIQDAYEQVRPPSIKGKRLKLFYATQVGTDPIRLRIFVNDPKIIRPAYRVYLIKSLRKRFGLEGAPVVLQFRARKSQYA
ncbi:MAG: ribosome biogenesis GTPase Der [Verrucomicrobia bacterium]|jgi:GTPase|nr:ribosome biogenesis GTPase Der [Verrucomicrobiota bacterium]